MANALVKRNLCMRFVAVAMACAMTLLAAPREAQAGLKEALNDMFITTGTSAQSIETQRLKGIYGGSMSLRPVGRGINIVQFAAPRIDAGCGGIDIFFGSFSFINGAQFEQLIRSIAANAVGFAIKAAIQGMCGPCANIIGKLEDAIRELNSLAKNSCATANAMFDKEGRGKLMESARKIGENISSAMSLTSDWLAGVNKSHSEKASQTASANGNAVAADNNPVFGNLVYRAAEKSMNNGTNTLSAFFTQKQVTEIVMSLYGTTIVAPPPKSGQACPAGSSPERCDQLPEKYGPTIYQWDQLFYPRKHSETGVKILSCFNAQCSTVGASELSLAAWGGVEEFVNIALFGVTEPSDESSYTADSLIGAFVHKTAGSSTSFSPKARALERVIPFPLVHALLELQKIKGAPATLGKQVATMLPKYFAYQMAVEFMSIGKNAFSGQTTVNMPVEYSDQMTDKSNQLIAMRPKEHELVDMFNKSIQSVDNIQKLTSTQYRAGNGGEQ